MNVQGLRIRITTWLASSALALLLLGLTTQPGSAAILYNPGGGSADGSALCNVGSHSFSLGMTLAKDPGYVWQNVQYAYRFTDARTGNSSVSPVYTHRVTSLSAELLGTSSVRVSGARLRIHYAVRFGTTSGYRPWSAWTPVAIRTTWLEQGWVKQPTPICYT